MRGSFKDGDRECSVKNDIKEMSGESGTSTGEARTRDLSGLGMSLGPLTQ